MTSVCAQRVLRRLLPVLLCTFANIAHAQSPVSAPWTAQDIGGPTPSGSTTYSNGIFTSAVGGTGITGRSDQFHFVYQAISGDTRLSARIDSLLPADPGSKIGIMIRSSLIRSAAHGFAFVSGGYGAGFYRRRTDGGGTVSTSLSTSAVAPVWLAIERVGTQITASASADGLTWTVIGTDAVALGQTAYVGFATTARSSTQRAQGDVSRAQFAGGFPAGQLHEDIGAPALAGSATLTQGRYSITAGGVDVWSAADQFHFVYQPVTGDVEVRARVTSLTAVDAWSKAGVMIRETLSASSANAFSILTGSAGYGFQRRLSTAASTSGTLGGSGLPPGWVRLVRAGNRFDSYKSLDGQTWTLMGSVDIPMGQTVYVGLAVTSHNGGVRTTAVIDNLMVATPSPPPVNQPPTVSLTSPATGGSWTAPATITLSASASDPEGRLSRVEFFANSALLGTIASAPYSATWSGVSAGTYALTAVATDSDGARTVSTPVTATVAAPVPSATSWFTVFTASADHATNVTSYRLNVFPPAANTSTATPTATSDLGKPTPDAGNEIRVDRSTFINGLAAGSYQATVTAIGPGGQTQGSPISFAR